MAPENIPALAPAVLDRAQGCLLGVLAGDSLGSLVEFQTPEQIRKAWPKGVRRLQDGGTWNTLAGQPTDDGEMALALARGMIAAGSWSPQVAADAYVAWYRTAPFDIGNTVQQALSGIAAEPDADPLEAAQFHANYDSQANGALMRIAPLAIFTALGNIDEGVSNAIRDAALTHPHPLCKQANALYVLALAHAIRDGEAPATIYEHVLAGAARMGIDPALQKCIDNGARSAPPDFTRHQGWLLIAFQNAIYQLLNAPDLETALVDTVARGGDTDTNAAICGGLLGAAHGLEQIPIQWREAVLACTPTTSNPAAHRPRPEFLWPNDALELAEALLRVGRA